MKALLLIVFNLTLSVGSIFTVPALNNSQLKNQLIQKKLSGIGCAPDWKNFKLSGGQVLSMIPLPGTGTHTWTISTKHDSASFYFNQGMNLYYGFHIIEAIPSFKKAISFDSSCALLHWAEALAYGPNINDLGYAASPDALAATEKAMQLITSVPEKEKLLIEAMNQRYSADSTLKRELLNQRYAEAMHKAYQRFPDDAEVGTLYADALMLLHPWDLWFHNGVAKPWTNEIVAVLEHVLQLSPEHPGANHYYIHAVEASPDPGRATASADRLGKLTPGLSHMVHMPSHIYIRTGEYAKGTRVNKDALIQYNLYLKLYPDVSGNAPLYDIHNQHMQAVCSMNEGDYANALKDARNCRNSFDTSFLSLPAPLGPFIQYVFMMPEFTMIQFERWNDILNEPLSARNDYSTLLQHFARGMAYANTKQLVKARASLQSLESLIDNDALAVPFGPFNTPKNGALIAKEILLATIFDNEGNLNQAQAHYKEAIVVEDALIYNEPRDWVLPARQFQGFALLRMKSFLAAQKVFKEDLRQHPKAPKSIKGLKLSIQKRTA